MASSARAIHPCVSRAVVAGLAAAPGITIGKESVIEGHTLAEQTAAIVRLRRRIQGERRRATTAALAPHARPVTPDLACGTCPKQRYWNDCYRRAVAYVLAHMPGSGRCPPVAGMTLVHGTCGSDSLLWAHAWVELPDGLVFCGVRQRFYDRAGFQQVLQATAEATYRPEEMVEWLLATQRYGPWHQGVLGDRPARRRDVAGRPAPVPAGQWDREALGHWGNGLRRDSRHQKRA